MRYVIEGLSYPQVLELKEKLKAEDIDSGETTGALAIYTNRINKLTEIVSEFKDASIIKGKSYLEQMVDD